MEKLTGREDEWRLGLEKAKKTKKIFLTRENPAGRRPRAGPSTHLSQDWRVRCSICRSESRTLPRPVIRAVRRQEKKKSMA